MLTKKNYIQLFACLVLWAGNVIAIKMAVNEVEPMVAATLRFVCAALIFLPFIKWPDKRTLKIIFQISMLMNVLHIGTLFIALDMLDAASVSILLQTQVVFATLLGMVLFRESIHWRTWTGMGATMGFTFGGDGMRAGVFRSIAAGKGTAMPPWGGVLAREQIQALVTHIESF